LIYIPWHFPLHKDSSITGASAKAELEFQKEYPDIYNHLLKYKKQLSERNKAETGIRYEWYALQRWGANYMDDFYKQKIVYNDIAQKLTFGLAESGMFFNNTVYFINSKDEDRFYLLALLNSSTIDWYYRTLSVQLGKKAVRMFSIYVEQIPIPQISPMKKELFNLLARKTQNNIQDIEIQKIEKQINDLVFDTYGFSEEEYNFIESQ
jgi:hypothetical protein